MDPNSITLGKYSLPFILSLFLGLIFKRTEIPNDLKPYIAAVCGCVLGVVGMYYNKPIGDSITFQLVADYLLAGLIAGTSATGIYEMTKGAPGASVYIPVDENNKRIPGAKVLKVKRPSVLK